MNLDQHFWQLCLAISDFLQILCDSMSQKPTKKALSNLYYSMPYGTAVMRSETSCFICVARTELSRFTSVPRKFFYCYLEMYVHVNKNAT